MGRMRGATCFLFKIFQTNRLLPLPCFPLRAGFACFITDCRLSFIFLVFAFHLSPCFPLRGKCLRKQTIEVNFNFFDFDTAFPLGGLFSPNYRLKVVLAAWCRRTATDEGAPLSPSKQVCTNNRKKSIQLFSSPPNANNTNLEKSGFVLFFAMFKHPPKFHLKFFQIFYVRKLNSD